MSKTLAEWAGVSETNYKTLTTAAAMVKRLRDGEGLTDEELRVGVRFGNMVIEYLKQLGPDFNLARKELRRVIMQAEGFIDARECAGKQETLITHVSKLLPKAPGCQHEVPADMLQCMHCGLQAREIVARGERYATTMRLPHC